MSGFNSHHSENIVSVAGRITRTAALSVVAGKDFYASDRGTGLTALTFPRSYVKLVSFVATSETPDATCILDKATFTDATVDTVDGSAALAKDSSTLIVPGMAISGVGIPADAYVVSITSATAFVISAAATANGTNITATLSPLTVGANSSVLCVKGEDGSDSSAKDADFSFIACFEVADS